MGNTQVRDAKEANEESANQILLNDVNGSSVKKVECEFPIHNAAYMGNVDKLKDLLSTSYPNSESSLVRKIDSAGMTPLHHAIIGASARSVEVASIILKADENSTGDCALENYQDAKLKTPLHYAAKSKRPELVALLLQRKADPNIKDEESKSPLHYAAEGDSEAAIKCVELLIRTPGILRDECTKDGQSVLHLAANASACEMLNFLISEGFSRSVQDSKGFTALHASANASDSEKAVKCVASLLQVSSFEEINARNNKQQSAMHLAAYKCNKNVLKKLLDDPQTDIWAVDSEKRTILHSATEAWFRPSAYNCVKLILDSDKISDWHQKLLFLYQSTDSKNNTALELACKYGSLKIAELLITAHSTPEAWLDDHMMKMIYSKLPEAMIPLMNKSLTYNPAVFHERNEAIDAEFGTVTGFQDPVDTETPQQETKYLRHVLTAPKNIQTRVFLHPLVHLFLDLKWDKIKWLTFSSIAFQFFWIILYTCMVFEVYNPNCPNEVQPIELAENSTHVKMDKKLLKVLVSFSFSSNSSVHENCEFNVTGARTFAVILYFMSALIAVKEVFQMIKNKNYVYNLSNWGQSTLLIVFVITSIPAMIGDAEVPRWQLYLASFGVFLAWMLSLREIGKFPRCGIYSAILKKVFWHCLKMLLFYFPLFVAFAMCLRLLLPGKGQYSYMLFAIIKVVIMMTGELDFEDAFYDENGPSLALNAIFGQLVFLLLVFMTTIVLLNLLTGLAVNDVQSLIEEAEVNRLSNELQQIYLLETILLWIRRWPNVSELGKSFFYSLNVTSTKFDIFWTFTSKIAGIETRNYPEKLRERIREFATPNDE